MRLGFDEHQLYHDAIDRKSKADNTCEIRQTGCDGQKKDIAEEAGEPRNKDDQEEPEQF